MLRDVCADLAELADIHVHVVTALGVLCCFAVLLCLVVCLILLASFSHLSLKHVNKIFSKKLSLQRLFLQFILCLFVFLVGYLVLFLSLFLSLLFTVWCAINVNFHVYVYTCIRWLAQPAELPW